MSLITLMTCHMSVSHMSLALTFMCSFSNIRSDLTVCFFIALKLTVSRSSLSNDASTLNPYRLFLALLHAHVHTHTRESNTNTGWDSFT